jgi:hypothetical protein
VVDAHARAEHVRVRGIGDDDLGKGLARRFVEQAAVMIDLQRLLDHAGVDVELLHVLDVTQAIGEGQTGGVAFGLGVDVEIDGALQAAANAGDLLGCADRRNEPRGAQRNPGQSQTSHGIPPLYLVFWKRYVAG